MVQWQFSLQPDISKEWNRKKETCVKGIVDSASELIGKTPMLYLHNYMKEAGVEDAAIIAKLEYFNPAGSVKDRVALAS